MYLHARERWGSKEEFSSQKEHQVFLPRDAPACESPVAAN
jgi:hypothetical protein